MDERRLIVDISLLQGRNRVNARFSILLGKANILVLTGPSGCGKSTVLKALCGFLRPESGHIQFGEALWFDSTKKIHKPTLERSTAYLPQTDVLLPSLSVRGNLEFAAGLAQKGWKSLFGGWLHDAQRSREVENMMTIFGIGAFADAKVKNLSGGQARKVSLARLFFQNPGLLLLDEPLSGTDPSSRRELSSALAKFIRERSLPTIWVTHDPIEVDGIPSVGGHLQPIWDNNERIYSLDGTFPLPTPVSGRESLIASAFRFDI